ncbi:MAG: DUF559 domain-containing protein [Patulibacter minatonensis]
MTNKRRPPTGTQLLISELKSKAQKQCGILHRDQLLEHGLSADTILGWVANGWLERRFRWTFAFPGTDRRLETRAWSAQLSAGGNASATSSQALALMEVVPELAGDFEVVRGDGRPRRQPGLVVHQSTYLPTDDLTVTRGIRHTQFARAVLDYAARATPDQVARALDRGTRLRQFDRAAFDRLLREYDGPGHLPVARALDRLDENTGLKRSELERRLVELILDSSIPTPVVNAMIGGEEVDIHWIGTRAIVEADGREHHSTPADIADDIARQRRLEALGFVLRRFDWDAVNYRPERTLEQVEQFRLANLAPPVPRLTQLR